MKFPSSRTFPLLLLTLTKERNAFAALVCEDSTESFVASGLHQDAGKKTSCDGAAKFPEKLCQFPEVKSNCPETCKTCDNVELCADSNVRFYVPDSYAPTETKSCVWVTRKKTWQRCQLKNVVEMCPVSCGKCNTFIGPLNDLVGRWEGNQGFVLISVPASGSTPSSNGDFKLLHFPYRETIEIKALSDGVENLGGSIDQLNGVCTYSKTVWATDKFPNNPDKQAIIHKEDGMFFYLDPVTTNPGKKPVSSKDKPPFSIGRSAVIPHGNTAMIFGDLTKYKGPPTIPDINTQPFTTPATELLGYFEGQAGGLQDKPTTMLQDALKNGPAVANTIHFSMSSKNGTGGVLNTDFITKRADTREYKVDMWVEDLGNNQKQLQYAETASIFFHFNQNVEINWPHVMVNTLTKVDEKDDN